MRPRWIRLVVSAYPRHIRRSHGEEIAASLAEDWRTRRGARGRLRWFAHLLRDVAATHRRPRSHHPSAAIPAARRRGGLDLAGDLRGAFRMFRQSPGFAAGAVLTLALGIGATTAIAGLADATLLRPLPVPDADRVLVSKFSWSYPDFRDYATRQTAFTDVAGWAGLDVGLEHAGTSHAVTATAASGAYARMLGLRPIAGRLLDERDDTPGMPAAVMISERLWRRVFGADQAVIGRTVQLNRRPAVITGVLPAAFRGTSLSSVPDLVLPLAAMREVSTDFLGREDTLSSRTTTFLQVGGRLKPGAGLPQAEEEANAIYATFHPRHDPSSGDRHRLIPLPQRATGLDESSDLRTFLFVLGGATMVTLLLACATVANLLLVRAERRDHEMALRTALGAGRWRLARLLTIESVVLGLAGAAGGLLVARVILRLLGAFSLPGDIGVADLRLGVDARLLAFAAALGLVTSLVFSLAPLWRAARVQPIGALRGSQGHSARQPLRAALVTAQVSLCVVLLGGGLAFGRAVRQAFALDLGFDTSATAIVSVNTSVVRYSTDQILDLQTRALDALRAAPSVQAAGWGIMRPLRGRLTMSFTAPGFAPERPDDHDVDVNVVTPGYFAAMGLPLVAGRWLTDSDVTGAPRAAVVSEALATRFWPNRPAVGERFSNDRKFDETRAITVVGVVGDIRRGLERDVDPMIYLPAAQRPLPFSFDDQHLFIRTAGGSPAAAASDAAAVLKRVDAIAPVSSVMTMREHVAGAAMVHRLGFTLFAAFATLAIVLTATGVYAVVAYAVARRRREIGIRLALGAPRAGVLRLVAAQGGRPIAAGIALGTLGFWLAGRGLSAFLLSTPAFDAPLVAAITAGIALVAGSAVVIPARRALAVAPVEALRQ
jgi:putative ABC transport system permease protein